MPYTQIDNQGYVLVNSSLPHFSYSPSLSWGFEGLSGMNGKRYLHYPKMNFYINDDGTVRAFGQESIPIVNRRGVNYIEIPVVGDKATSTWWTGSNQYSVQNYYRIPVGKTTKYVEPQVLQPKPKQTEEKQKIVEEDTKPIIIKPNIILYIAKTLKLPFFK